MAIVVSRSGSRARRFRSVLAAVVVVVPLAVAEIDLRPSLGGRTLTKHVPIGDDGKVCAVADAATHIAPKAFSWEGS